MAAIRKAALWVLVFISVWTVRAAVLHGTDLDKVQKSVYLREPRLLGKDTRWMGYPPLHAPKYSAETSQSFAIDSLKDAGVARSSGGSQGYPSELTYLGTASTSGQANIKDVGQALEGLVKSRHYFKNSKNRIVVSNAEKEQNLDSVAEKVITETFVPDLLSPGTEAMTDADDKEYSQIYPVKVGGYVPGTRQVMKSRSELTPAGVTFSADASLSDSQAFKRVEGNELKKFHTSGLVEDKPREINQAGLLNSGIFHKRKRRSEQDEQSQMGTAETITGSTGDVQSYIKVKDTVADKDQVNVKPSPMYKDNYSTYEHSLEDKDAVEGKSTSADPSPLFESILQTAGPLRSSGINDAKGASFNGSSEESTSSETVSVYLEHRQDKGSPEITTARLVRSDRSTETLTPETIIPGAVTTEKAALEKLTPETLTSESMTTEILTPKTLASESMTTEILTPETLTSESMTTEILTPETLTSESMTTEILTPETLTSESMTTDTQVTETKSTMIEPEVTAHIDKNTVNLDTTLTSVNPTSVYILDASTPDLYATDDIFSVDMGTDVDITNTTDTPLPDKTETLLADVHLSEAPTTEDRTKHNPTTDVHLAKAPTTENPTTEDPTKEDPTTDVLLSEAPTTEDRTKQDPTTDDPTTEDHPTENHTKEDPTTEDPTTEDPTTDDPTTENPTTENPTTENPTTENPTTEDPTTEDPTTEDPTTEDPTTEDPTTEDPTTENPTTENPTTEDPTTEDPTTEDPTTEDPLTEDPTTEDPTTYDPSTYDPTIESHTTYTQRTDAHWSTNTPNTEPDWSSEFSPRIKPTPSDNDPLDTNSFTTSLLNANTEQSNSQPHQETTHSPSTGDDPNNDSIAATHSEDSDSPFYNNILDWELAKHTWQSAWEIHVYVFGSLFALVGLYGTMSFVRLWWIHCLFPTGYFIPVHGLIVFMCCTRCFYMLYDGYGSNGTFHPALDHFLYSVAFPCLTSAFGLLFYSLLRTTQVQLLSRSIQKIQALVFLIVVHFLISITTDVLVGFHADMQVAQFVCHVYFLTWGTFLFVGYVCAFAKLRRHALKRQSEGVYTTTTSVYTSSGNLKSSLTLSAAVKAMLFAALCGIVIVAMEVFAIVQVYMTFTRGQPEPWIWWFYQSSLRIIELAVYLSLCYVVSLPLRYRTSEHKCSCGVFCAPCSEIFCCGSNLNNPKTTAGYNYCEKVPNSIYHETGDNLTEGSSKKLLYNHLTDVIPTFDIQPTFGSRPNSLLIVEDGYVRFQTDYDINKIVDSCNDLSQKPTDVHNVSTFLRRDGFVNTGYSIHTREDTGNNNNKLEAELTDKSRKSSMTSSEFFRVPSSVSLADSMENELSKAFESFKLDDSKVEDQTSREHYLAETSSFASVSSFPEPGLKSSMTTHQPSQPRYRPSDAHPYNGSTRQFVTFPRAARSPEVSRTFNDPDLLSDPESQQRHRHSSLDDDLGFSVSSDSPSVRYFSMLSNDRKEAQMAGSQEDDDDLDSDTEFHVPLRRPSEGQGSQAVVLTSLLKDWQSASNENIDV